MTLTLLHEKKGVRVVADRCAHPNPFSPPLAQSNVFCGGALSRALCSEAVPWLIKCYVQIAFQATIVLSFCALATELFVAVP
jgi:hypothetical protein